MKITRFIVYRARRRPVSALAHSANPITAGAKAQFDAVSGFIVRAAEKVPEAPMRSRPPRMSAPGPAVRARRRRIHGDVLHRRRRQAATHRHREGRTGKANLVVA